MAAKVQPNPFYSNHVFNDFDLQRCAIRFSDRLRVLFRRTYAQTHGKHMFYYKQDGRGAYYLMGVEEINIFDCPIHGIQDGPDCPKEVYHATKTDRCD